MTNADATVTTSDLDMTAEAKMAKLIARIWSDAAFKAALMANPRSLLTSLGAKLPPGVRIELVEDNSTTVHLILPARPDASVLSDESLDSIAGGAMHLALPAAYEAGAPTYAYVGGKTGANSTGVLANAWFGS